MFDRAPTWVGTTEDYIRKALEEVRVRIEGTAQYSSYSCVPRGKLEEGAVVFLMDMRCLCSEDPERPARPSRQFVHDFWLDTVLQCWPVMADPGKSKSNDV